MNVVFRKTTRDDLDLLVQLRIDFLLDQKNGKPLENQEKLLEEARSYFIKAMEKGEFLAAIAEQENEVLSVAFLSIAERPPRPGKSSNRVGTIYNVFTYPEYRRKGLAEKVLKLLIDEAVKNRVATVDLCATEAGKPLYEKLGFQPPQNIYMRLKDEMRR